MREREGMPKMRQLTGCPHLLVPNGIRIHRTENLPLPGLVGGGQHPHLIVIVYDAIAIVSGDCFLKHL